MFDELEKRVAVVTGGGSGIGRAIAKILAAHGALVRVADVDRDASQSAVAEIRSSGGPAEADHLDVGAPDEIVRFAERLTASCGGVDILVNNAGIVSRKGAAELSVKDWDRTLDVNLRAAFLLTRELFPCMRQRGRGAVVNMSSLAALNGGIAVGADYVASKAGLVGLTRHFARLGAPHGIRVNAVCPGIIGTRVTTALDEKRLADLVKQIPMGRFGTPEEVARVVLFLVSDMASYVSGETINVSGGIVA